MKVNEIVTEGIGDYVRGVFSADPAHKGKTFQSRADSIKHERILDNLTTRILQSWNQKYSVMVRSNKGRQLSRQEYTTYLKDFIKKVLYSNQSLGSLDARTRRLLGRDIDNIVNNRHHPSRLEHAFRGLISDSLSQRADPKRAHK